MTNGIRKVRKGYFQQKILILVSSSQTQCFRIRPRLQQSFPRSRQRYTNIIVHGAQQLSRIYFLFFLFPCFWEEGRVRGGEKPPTPLSALVFSIFASRVYVLPCYSTQGSVQPQETGESSIKNLTVLNSLDAYTYRPDSIKRIKVFSMSSDNNNS